MMWTSGKRRPGAIMRLRRLRPSTSPLAPVHMTGGVAALIAAACIGVRKHSTTRRPRPAFGQARDSA